MGPPGSKTKPSTQRSSAALALGKEADGARFIKAGFARDAEADLQFALGWPQMRFLVQGHPDDAIADPVKAAQATIQKQYGTDVPAGIARKRVRVLTINNIAPDDKGGWLPAAVGEALANDAPVTEKEARSIIASQWQKTHMGAGQHDMILLLEALVGSEIVADALVTALESIPASELRAPHQDRNIWTHHLGLILLRVSTPTANALRARLQKVLDGAGPSTSNRAPTRTLDVVLHGREGAERSGQSADPWQLLNVNDAPDLVATQVEAQKVEPSTFVPYVRLAFLGGDRVLDAYATRWQKLKSADDVRAFFLGLTRIAKGKALPILHEMAGTSKVKKEVAAWFLAHPELPQPKK